MAAAYNERHDEIDELLLEFNERLDPGAVVPHEGPSWYEAVQRLSGFDLTRGNRVDLLVNDDATFNSILAGSWNVDWLIDAGTGIATTI